MGEVPLRRIVLVAFVIMILLGAATLTFHLSSVKAITVPDDYSTIQQAVNAANPGDTVYVRAGMYFENLAISKPISLIGAGAGSTKIDGRTRYAMYLTGSDIIVDGFTLEVPLSQTKNNDVVLMLSCNDSLLTNNVIHGGAPAYRPNPGWSLGGIEMTGCYDNTIEENQILDTDEWAVMLFGCHGNNIRKNTINNTWMGVWLMESDNNLVEKNTVTHGAPFLFGELIPPPTPPSGVSIWDGDMNEVAQNVISDTYYGISVTNSSATNLLVGNSITSSGYDYLVQKGSL